MNICKNENKNELMEFLLQKPTENSFFIGDIENFDLDDECIDIWQFKNNEQISSILLRFYKFYLIASENDGDLKGIAEIIRADKECMTVSGMDNTINKLAQFMKFKNIRKSFLAELNHKTVKSIKSEYLPQKATVKDIEDLFEFQKSIPEFSTDEEDRDRFGKEITTNTGKIYYIKKNNQIVSSATITAENSVNGTIIDVATDNEYRGKGYAEACVFKICKEMINDGKSVVLFYDNPNAGKLYKKIGFFDVGIWSRGILK